MTPTHPEGGRPERPEEGTALMFKDKWVPYADALTCLNAAKEGKP